MLLKSGDRKYAKPESCIKSSNLIRQSSGCIINKADLISKKKYSSNNSQQKDEFTITNNTSEPFKQMEIVSKSINNSVSTNHGEDRKNFSGIPLSVNSQINSAFNIVSTPSLCYQQYQQFTSSSSYLNEGITIQQNVVSTTTVTLPSNGRLSETPQIAFENPLSFQIHDKNHIQYSESPLFHKSQIHTIDSLTPTIDDNLTNSLRNISLHNSSNILNKNGTGIVSNKSLNNSCNLPINGDSFKLLSTFDQRSNCPPPNKLNHSPSLNLFHQKPLMTTQVSDYQPRPSPSSPAYQELKSKIDSQSQQSKESREHQEHLSKFNTDNLTPSRRMVNVMEERVLIPPTGITHPIPNILHFTKKMNCSPDIMRCTLNAVPYNDELLNKTRLPLAILIHPFRDLASLQVIRSKKIIRCRTMTCRAYINPFVSFIDHRRWKCNMCLRINELSDDSIYNDSTGEYLDTSNKRLELRLPTVEYIAPKEYSLKKNSNTPVFVFLIDISGNSTRLLYRNTVSRILSTIVELLERLPGYSCGGVKISVIGYDNYIHLYSLNGKGKYREIVLSDIIGGPVDIPVASEQLAVDLRLHSDSVKELLSCLLDNVDTGDDGQQEQQGESDSCLGSALEVAKSMFSGGGGRVTVLNASCPTVGEGVLRPRGRVAQKSSCVLPLFPEKEFYKTMSLEFAQIQVAVDLFQLGSIPCDLASLSVITRYCGGSLFYYPGLSLHTVSTLSTPQFPHNNNSSSSNCSGTEKSLNETQRLLADLHRYLTRKIGFDAVLRLRLSGGLSVLSSQGNFFARAPDLFSLPNINPDCGFSVRLSPGPSDCDLHDSSSAAVFLQAALLYTAPSGERRIRVHTLCLPLTPRVQDVFRAADHQAVAVLLLKSLADRLQTAGKVPEAREALINSATDPSVAFGTFCLPTSLTTTALPFPFHLRLLPLSVWAILQSPALSTSAKGHGHTDLSVSILDSWRRLPLSSLLPDISPALYDLLSLLHLTPRQRQLFPLENTPNLYCDDADGDNREPEDDEEVEGHSSSSSSCCSSSSSSPPSSPSNISGFTSKSLNNNITEINNNIVDNDCDEDFWYPRQLHLSMESLSRAGVYLLDTRDGLILLLGVDTPQSFLKLVFGVDKRSEISTESCFELPDLNNPCSAHLRVFIRELQVERPIGSSLFIINNDKSVLNNLFMSYLYEDDKLDASYHRFLQYIHRKVVGKAT